MNTSFCQHYTYLAKSSAFVKWMAVAVILAYCNGCSNLSGPDYQRPELPDKPQWSNIEGRQLQAQEIIRMDWWTAFDDPYLNELIETALSDGLDLKLAFLRLEKAGIGLRKDRFPLTPSITAGPSRSYQRGKQEGGATETTRSKEALGLNLSWEIDIWGKVRKGVMASEATYKSTEMELRGAYLTLITSVSEQYFQIRQYDEQIAQQQAALVQNEELLDIWKLQYQEGMVAETKILSQKSEISSRRQQLLELRRSREEAELKLATLIGKPAGSLSVAPAHLSNTVKLIPEPEVLPGELLARRPDILAAEYNLLASHHLLGKARLSRLPSLKLGGSARSGSDFTSLISSWNYAFNLDWTSMLSRDLKIDVEISEAELRIQTETYRKTVLNAFEEVEIALLNLDFRRAQLEELEQQIASLEIVHKVQKAQLREGLVSQLEVFDTERTLLEAQQGILTNYRSLLSDILILYKAVGGGWPVEQVADLR